MAKAFRNTNHRIAGQHGRLVERIKLANPGLAEPGLRQVGVSIQGRSMGDDVKQAGTLIEVAAPTGSQTVPVARFLSGSAPIDHAAMKEIEIGINSVVVPLDAMHARSPGHRPGGDHGLGVAR